jgi:hypothetical protein
MAAEAYSAMSRWFTDAAVRVVYVHVGEDLPIDGAFEVRTFSNMYGLGTVAYLKTLCLVIAVSARQSPPSQEMTPRLQRSELERTSTSGIR